MKHPRRFGFSLLEVMLATTVLLGSVATRFPKTTMKAAPTMNNFATNQLLIVSIPREPSGWA